MSIAIDGNGIGVSALSTSAKAELKSGRKNLIINGAMQVAQRGTSISFGAAYTLDRWRVVGGSSPARVATQENNTSYSTVPHEKYLKVTNPQGQSMWVTQRIENARQFSGKTLTVSYWVWSTTGSYTASAGSWGALQDANSSQYTVSGWSGASVSVTTTPQYVTHTFTFADISSYIHTEGDFFEWNIYNPTSNDMCITGVQLELGDTATDFEHRSYEEEKTLCKRYFERINGNVDTYVPFQNTLGLFTSGSSYFTIGFSEKRSAPSVTTSGSFRGQGLADTGISSTMTAALFNEYAGRLELSASFSGTNGQCGVLQFRTNGGYIDLDSEL